jgi:exodeoxyribonuclease VII small subunit
MAKKKSNSTPPLGFEEALAALQEVVKHLESGKLTLDEALGKYEAGIGLLKHCYESLDNVEQKIRLLMSVDEAGRAVTQDFQHSATHVESTGKRPPANRGPGQNAPPPDSEQDEDEDFVEEDGEDDDDPWDDDDDDSPGGLF